MTTDIQDKSMTTDISGVGKRQRYDFMNVLRVISMALIVFYHMVFTLYIMGIRQLESVRVFYENANIHIAKLGVSTFFMLSGAGLMLSAIRRSDGSGDKSSAFWDIKDTLSFYKTRFIKILIPFYIVYAGFFIYLAYLNGWDFANVFAGRNVPPVCFAFTVLGMDAYFANFNILTFSLGIGEWFLGCLILIYLVFPLLKAAMMKNKYITMAASVVYYVVILLVYTKIPVVGQVAPFLSFLVKIFDFVLGMFLILFLEDKELKEKAGWLYKVLPFVSAAVFIFFVIFPKTLPGIDTYLIVIYSSAFFLIFYFLEPLFNKAFGCMKVIKTVSSYSYEFFLIHHVVIDALTSRRMNMPFSNKDIVVLFFTELVVTTMLTIIVKMLTSIPGYIKRNR